jgi:hypothetical protein
VNLPVRITLPLTTSYELWSLLTLMLPPAAILAAVVAPPAAGASGFAGVVEAAADGAGVVICDGQGGSAARAVGMMLPSTASTIQNGPERSMKASIIMVRRSRAGRKTPTLQHV